MSQHCPRCHGIRFAAARLEGAEGLAVVLEDGKRSPLEAILCRDCGFVYLMATREPPAAGRGPGGEEVQEYDF